MQSCKASERRFPRGGFTLMEVLAAIFLTSIVITFAVSFFISLSNSSQRAIDHTRESLQAVAVLDRVARDLANTALMVKAEDEDPLSHPWSFVAEGQATFDGSDAIKFNARSRSPNEETYHTSDLVQVSYQVLDEEDGSLTLYRWSSPGLPFGQEPGYPSLDDPRTFMVAEGLDSFSLRFLDDEGEWLTSWDSTQVEKSGELPRVVEIDVSMWSEEKEETWSEDGQRHFLRQVVLRQRPLDLNEMILKRDEESVGSAAGGAGVGGGSSAQGDLGDLDDQVSGDGEFEGAPAPAGSVADCIRRNWSACVAAHNEGSCGAWANATKVPLGAFGIDLPWCQ